MERMFEIEGDEEMDGFSASRKYYQEDIQLEQRLEALKDKKLNAIYENYKDFIMGGLDRDEYSTHTRNLLKGD
jgi:hypothetical protein